MNNPIATFLVGPEPLNLPHGLHRLSREDYVRIPAFNQSTLKKWLELATVKGDFRRCPARFRHWWENRHTTAPSDAIILGSALDAYCLGPEELDANFAFIPEGAPKRPTKAQLNAKKPSPETLDSIAWWREFESLTEGKTILTASDMERVKGMHAALMANTQTAEILSHCQKTVLVSELAGYPVKCEIDLFEEKSHFLFDLKSAASVDDEEFGRHGLALGYPGQAGWYLAIAQSLGFKKHAFTFAAVENEPPHWVNTPTLQWESPLVQHGLNRLTKAMEALADHITNDDWPAYAPFRPMRFPGWSEREAEIELAAA